jgi:hypothetical protein
MFKVTLTVRETALTDRQLAVGTYRRTIVCKRHVTR